MKVICLLPVRDEADIIGQTLDHALKMGHAICAFERAA
jgi:hypothetical protein